MALDKVIDSAVLDAGLTSVADAIRAKGGTSEQLAFPNGFVSAVEGIQSGGNKSVARGSFTLASSTATYPEIVHNLGSQKIAVVIVPSRSESPVVSADRRATLYLMWVNLPAFVAPQDFDFSAHNTNVTNPYSVNYSKDMLVVRSTNNNDPVGEVVSWIPTSYGSFSITDNSVVLNSGAYPLSAGEYDWYVGVIA